MAREILMQSDGKWDVSGGYAGTVLHINSAIKTLTHNGIRTIK